MFYVYHYILYFFSSGKPSSLVSVSNSHLPWLIFFFNTFCLILFVVLFLYSVVLCIKSWYKIIGVVNIEFINKHCAIYLNFNLQSYNVQCVRPDWDKSRAYLTQTVITLTACNKVTKIGTNNFVYFCSYFSIFIFLSFFFSFPVILFQFYFIMYRYCLNFLINFIIICTI